MALACAGNPGPGESGYPFNVAGTYMGQVSTGGLPPSGSLTPTRALSRIRSRFGNRIVIPFRRLYGGVG
jgi:hypothetical protein